MDERHFGMNSYIYICMRASTSKVNARSKLAKCSEFNCRWTFTKQLLVWGTFEFLVLFQSKWNKVHYCIRFVRLSVCHLLWSGLRRYSNFVFGSFVQNFLSENLLLFRWPSFYILRLKVHCLSLFTKAFYCVF